MNCWIFLIIGIIIISLIFVQSNKEHFTQGYDYVISGCIKRCELDLLRKNPYFVQLQEGGRMTQNYCRLMCANEFNKTNNCDNKCKLKKETIYGDNLCNFKRCGTRGFAHGKYLENGRSQYSCCV